jgi:hypothetical protein
MSVNGIPDLYGEAGAFEALQGHMRRAEEAARAGRQKALQEALQPAIEAATMLGTYLSDDRWYPIIATLDKARDRLVKVDPFAYRDPSFRTIIGDRLAEIRLGLVHLRHGAVRH